MITRVFSLANVTADQLRWTPRPWRRWTCLCVDAVGPMELARLAEVLGMGRRDEILTGFAFLAGESQESPWVVAVPEALVARLARVDGAELQTAGRVWADAVGWVGPERDRVLESLEGLRRFVSGDNGPYGLYIVVNDISHKTGGIS